MRVAWIKVGGLWPLNTGGRLRTFQTISELSRRHQVVLVTTHGPADRDGELAAQLPRCERVISIPYSAPKQGSLGFVGALARSWMSRYPIDLWRWRVPGVRRAVVELLSREPFDVVIADFLVAEPNLPSSLRVPLVFFAHNVEHQIWKRLAGVEKRSWRRLPLEVEWRKMRRREAAAVRRADATVAVSEIDRAALLRDAPGALIDVVPTGVDTDFFAPSAAPTVPRRLVFSGSMDWYPNEDAILEFAQHVWPRLNGTFPDVSLTVVGRNPSDRIRELGRVPGIVITGTVDDVRPHVAAAEVYVVPLRVGGGTRLKIFEALAMGKAVVSTTIGAEGLGLVDGRHFIAADGNGNFAQAVTRLLDDEAARRRLGESGRDLVERHFGWNSVARQFERSLENAVAHHGLAGQVVRPLAS